MPVAKGYQAENRKDINMTNKIISLNDLYILGVLVLILSITFGIKVLFEKMNSKSIEYIMINKSPALAVRLGAMMFSVILAISGEMTGESLGLTRDIGSFILYSLIVIVLLLLAILIGDKLLLSKIDNMSALQKNNLSVAVFEALYIISTGIILKSSLTGDEGGILSMLIFFLLGQSMLIGFFSLILIWTPFDDVVEIEANNFSAGLLLGGLLLSLSIINYYSILGESSTLMEDITSYFISSIKGIVLLIGFSALIDKVLFLKKDIVREAIVTDKNWGLVLVLVLINIATAVSIGINI